MLDFGDEKDGELGLKGHRQFFVLSNFSPDTIIFINRQQIKG